MHTHVLTHVRGHVHKRVKVKTLCAKENFIPTSTARIPPCATPSKKVSLETLKKRQDVANLGNFHTLW